ncbi:hypothetical protein FRC07_004078, partial [Ceratobasidium sp. 392]
MKDVPTLQQPQRLGLWSIFNLDLPQWLKIDLADRAHGPVRFESDERMLGLLPYDFRIVLDLSSAGEKEELWP